MTAINSVQFDQQRLDSALAIPVEERRLRSMTARKVAAQKNSAHWALQAGGSRVLLSRSVYRDPVDAEQTAYLMATRSKPSGVDGVNHV